MTASATRSNGTLRTSTPRRSCARNGNSVDVNWPSATTTSAPSGSDAAIRPIIGDAWWPIATHDSGTCSSRANTPRAAVMAAS